MALAERIPKTFNTVRIIEWIIAICTLAGAAFVFTPLYDISTAQNGPGIIAQVASSSAFVVIFALILILGSVLVMAGIKTKQPKVRSSGWFLIIITRFFQILSTFVVQGLLPIAWIYPLTIMLVCTVLYGAARIEAFNNGP